MPFRLSHFRKRYHVMKTYLLPLLAVLLFVQGCYFRQNLILDQTAIAKANKGKFPAPYGYVNDFEHILSDSQGHLLDSICEAYEKRTSNQVFIVTIEDIQPYESISQFTTELGNYWRVGQKNKDNGLLITVSSKLRKIWIGTGYGTEKILQDQMIREVIDTTILPHFREGDLYTGIRSGLEELIILWDTNTPAEK